MQITRAVEKKIANATFMMIALKNAFQFFLLATLFHSFSDASLEVAFRSSNVSAMGQISIVKLEKAARKLLLPALTVVQVWVKRLSYDELRKNNLIEEEEETSPFDFESV